MKMKRSFWQQWKEAEPGMRDKMRLTMNAIAENEYFARAVSYTHLTLPTTIGV